MAPFRIVCMLVVAPLTLATTTCNQVAGNMSRWVQYIRGAGPLPTSCCAGIRNLINAAHTTKDRQTGRKCLQVAASSIPGIRPNPTAGLPGKCGISIPYKISTSTNCAQFK